MTRYDAILIGGGAAGLFCAGQRAQRGERVLVLEGRDRPARKLLITGKGRCNVTNNCTNEVFLANVRTNPRFLYSAINAFSTADAMAFFEGLGVPLKTERGGRVFPVSDKAADIVDALLRYCRSGGVEILTARAKGLTIEDGAVTGVALHGGTHCAADTVILATGGMSYPATGSDGEGYRIAAQAGHTIVTPRASLVPLLCADDCGMFPTLAGLSPRNVTLMLYAPDGKKLWTELGEMLFTHEGVSGPLALTASTYLDGDPRGHRLCIDWKPGLNLEQLDARLLRDFSETPNKLLENSLDRLLPRALIPQVIRLSGVPGGTRIHTLTRAQRAQLCACIKAFTLTVAGTGPIAEAIVTAGGVAVGEVNPKNMESKRIGGLRFAGEILDVDARTGGFNLQTAWSTAYLAANR